MMDDRLAGRDLFRLLQHGDGFHKLRRGKQVLCLLKKLFGAILQVIGGWTHRFGSMILLWGGRLCLRCLAASQAGKSPGGEKKQTRQYAKPRSVTRRRLLVHCPNAASRGCRLLIGLSV